MKFNPDGDGNSFIHPLRPNYREVNRNPHHWIFESYFPSLVELLQKFRAWVCHLFSLFLPLFPSLGLFLPNCILGLTDLDIHPLFCINNGSVTLANPFHLTSNDLWYIGGKENRILASNRPEAADK